MHWGGFHWQCLLIGEIISLNTFKVSFVIITNMIYKENLRIYFTILDECFPLCVGMVICEKNDLNERAKADVKIPIFCDCEQ